MSNIIKTWWRRRKITRRLIAFAKTKEGYEFILSMNEGNLILADFDAYELGAEIRNIGKPLRIRLPNDYVLSK